MEADADNERNKWRSRRDEQSQTGSVGAHNSHNNDDDWRPTPCTLTALVARCQHTLHFMYVSSKSTFAQGRPGLNQVVDRLRLLPACYNSSDPRGYVNRRFLTFANRGNGFDTFQPVGRRHHTTPAPVSAHHHITSHDTQPAGWPRTT